MSFCFVYDGSFDGFLTAIFEAYRLKLPVRSFAAAARYSPNLFEERYSVETSPKEAERVWKRIVEQGGDFIGKMLFASFLSELPDVERQIWEYLQKLFSEEGKTFARNPISAEVMPLIRITNSVRRERDRLHGFLRFQKLEEELFFAGIEPEYHIIPLITPHFVRRFPQFSWIIWDIHRKKGVFFDRKTVEEITIDRFHLPRFEDDFCKMWKSYYQSTCTQERKNLLLQRQMLPRRYWAQLPEKN